MEIVRWTLFFFVHSFAGWFLETVYALYVHRKFVNRGFCVGPWCPMYGVSGIALVLCLGPLRDNIPLVFIGGALLVTVVEYTVSFVLEKLFKTRWWDYRDKIFNVHGRVCLTFSLAWGLVSIALVRYIHPFIAYAISFMHDATLLWVTVVITVFFTVDLGATAASLLHLKTRLKRLSAVFDHMKEQGVSRIENLSGDLKALYTKLTGGTTRRQRRLLRTFPNARSRRFGETLDRLRESLVLSRKNKSE